MEEYLKIISEYASYVDWVNLILLYTSILFFWNWVTLITNFHKRSNSAIEYFIRNLSVFPFWIIFLIYTFNFLSPINYYSLNNTFKKEIFIENNTGKSLELNFYGKGDNEYYSLFNNWENYLDNDFEFEKNSKNKIVFNIDTSIIKYLYITKNDEISSFNYSNVFEINNTKLIVFADEFSKNPTKPIEVDNSYYYKLLLIFILSLLGSWYYYFLAFMKRNKKIFLIISISVSFVSLTTIFFILRILI